MVRWQPGAGRRAVTRQLLVDSAHHGSVGCSPGQSCRAAGRVGGARARAELGRHLFYDQRLSANGTQSCASCHRQELAFTDGRAVAVGSTGEAHPRNSMTLVNVRSAATLTWADPSMTSLERQALVPMFGEHPVELGARRGELARVLRADPMYRALILRAIRG